MGDGEEGNGERQEQPTAEADMSEGAKVALLAFRAAVAEVQSLSTAAEDESAPADEEAMRAAKAKLAAAMRTATLAGVSAQTLLEASAPPEEEEDQEQQPEGPQMTEGELKNGSRVEIFGLESESGKALNGQVGHIAGFLEEKGRYQVTLAPDKVVSLKPDNLKQLPAESGPKQESAGGADASGHVFQAGERVEVSGLESEAGRKLNERVGVTKEFLADKGRWTIEMEDTKEVVSVRPANLSFVDKAADDGSGSSSALEAMLKGERVRDDRRKKSARDAGAAAARFANEAESGTLQPGDRVEVVGLQSASGKALNGKQGLITKWDEMKGRFQVDLFMANLQSLKPENLKQVIGGAQRTHSPEAGGCGEFESYSGSTAGYTLL
ncbi:hypothetical protein AK812_SmicGene3655 [Symbiodinium microadriaticum]|uniref:Uncharacterized protein n=1 Tax=Symbiodinium microadriaticum TaxID=2951 RepID=A0A1Q9EYE1_SYMMI|nr:hypothetical protein AK812_SmicGene3655 [Symbiodinium microadriaticum]